MKVKRIQRPKGKDFGAIFTVEYGFPVIFLGECISISCADAESLLKEGSRYEVFILHGDRKAPNDPLPLNDSFGWISRKRFKKAETWNTFEAEHSMDFEDTNDDIIFIVGRYVA